METLYLEILQEKREAVLKKADLSNEKGHIKLLPDLLSSFIKLLHHLPLRRKSKLLQHEEETIANERQKVKLFFGNS